jgi:hypothetical protein
MQAVDRRTGSYQCTVAIASSHRGVFEGLTCSFIYRAAQSATIICTLSLYAGTVVRGIIPTMMLYTLASRGSENYFN